MILDLAKNAIDYLKDNYSLPDKGFIAGGSIANLIWEEVSGVKAIINDIDIFVLEDILEARDNNKESYHEYIDGEKVILYDSYMGLRYINKRKNFYSISSSERDGIFNYIYYDSNIDDREIILESFDLNCVMIGYLIEENKFIWTKEFEEFITQRKIKVINATTPRHTVVRIVKKSDEMQVELDNIELEILEYVIGSHTIDDSKKMFMDRYADMFEKYKHLLPMFTINKQIEEMKIIKQRYNSDDNLWSVYSKIPKRMYDLGYNGSYLSSSDIVYYLRKINDNEKLKYVWLKLSDLFVDDYINDDYDKEDVDYLYKFYSFFPEALLNIRGLLFNEQISLIKKLFETFEDKSIAIALLEEKKVNSVKDLLKLDSMSKMMLELSVRKKIIDDALIDRVDGFINKKSENFLNKVEI